MSFNLLLFLLLGGLWKRTCQSSREAVSLGESEFQLGYKEERNTKDEVRVLGILLVMSNEFQLTQRKRFKELGGNSRLKWECTEQCGRRLEDNLSFL